MSNGGGISNENDFEKVLDELSKGFDVKEKSMVNRVAAERFKEIMTSDDRVPKRDDVNEPYHIRDNFLIVEDNDGRVVVGFTAKSKKGYIARLLNDGWTPVGRGQRGKSNGNKPVAGLHFWERTESEAKNPVRKVMIDKASSIMKRKVD
ncbi:HK97 gp10 family phage protein [Pediococcus claussenii]|uniref:HK97 gp10 family phage protein n=1 Tax=Pediococcus claussenii TaxID=187452 RepID=UPI00081A792E|nr:HK97 gp10 family phage protein [Pediococcus claussenii]ANZ70372.1 hypothetical protein AYR57_08610 [Pediococcus claussenii]ANZ72188.1 hypothetical protein AYR58_08610 [Pediococcus claussenii]